MDRRTVFIRMFKEVIKHAERDGCYNCKELVKALDLKAKVKAIKRRDIV